MTEGVKNETRIQILYRGRKRISLFKLGNFSSTILLKIFSVPLTWAFSFFSISIIHKFGIFIVSQISWMFCVRNVLYLIFS